MNDKIQQIKLLLTQLETEVDSGEGDIEFKKNFESLEIPSIVSDIICFLQPNLEPIEAAIYWHLFDKAILKTGQQYCRVSTRGLMTGVVKSSRSGELALQTTRGALQTLEEKGVIKTTGEPNKEGTPYKVLLPDEIPFCMDLKLKSESNNAAIVIDEKRESDFYNIKENRIRVFERDSYICRYCAKQLTRFTATLDHIQPVSQGGDNSYDNLVTACLHCNSRRGSNPVMNAIINGKSAQQGDAPERSAPGDL